MRASILGMAMGASAIVFASAPRQLSAQVPQGQAAPAMSRDEIANFAKVQIAISAVHDSVNAQLAQARNKTSAQQAQLLAVRRLVPAHVAARQR